MKLTDKMKEAAKLYIDANVWDGEDRAGATHDRASFDPDELQELVNETIEASIDHVDIDGLKKEIVGLTMKSHQDGANDAFKAFIQSLEVFKDTGIKLSIDQIIEFVKESLKKINNPSTN